MTQKLEIKWMFVTPQMAHEWSKLNTQNRRRCPWRENLYARELKAGRWHATHQGIAFIGHFEVLADGQTRLEAIKKSGVGAWMFVCWGLTRDAMLVLDQPRQRAVYENLILAGVSSSAGRTTISTLKAIALGCDSFGKMEKTASMDEMAAMLAEHEDALRFSFEALPDSRTKRGLTSSAVRGVIGRASYTVNHDLLYTFAEVLKTGESSLTERPSRGIILLRDLLLVAGAGTSELRRMAYRKTQRALDAFVKGEPLGKLYATDGELFPIPSRAEAA